MERLDKFLCDCGVGTRSQVKAILKTGAVTVDGAVQKDGSAKIDPQKSVICFRGEALNRRSRVVLMLNKPAGFVTATEDPVEKTVMELLPQEYRRLDVKPVGRLISPKKDVAKVYYAQHEGTAATEDVEAFAEGITLRDGTACLPAKLESLGEGESLITVREGKYHQVRRMMASRNMTVTYLERRQEGPLTLGDLPRGQVRELTEEELMQLESSCQ